MGGAFSLTVGSRYRNEWTFSTQEVSRSRQRSGKRILRYAQLEEVWERHRVLNTKTQSKNYVNAFAGAVAALSHGGEDLTARALEMLVNDFDADRAELWLWDGPSGSCYLTHEAGQKAARRRDYAEGGAGAIGKLAFNKTSIENIVLGTFGGDEQDFARKTGLTHISGYPLLSGE